MTRFLDSQSLRTLSQRLFAVLLVAAVAMTCFSSAPCRGVSRFAEAPANQLVEILAEDGVVTQRACHRNRLRAALAPRPLPAPPPATAPPAPSNLAAPREIDSHNGHGAPLLC